MALNIPDPTGKTFAQWADEFVDSNPDRNLPVTPPSESQWRGWANECLIDELFYPGSMAYREWFFWAQALQEVET